jgi:hypothetical protein
VTHDVNLLAYVTGVLGGVRVAGLSQGKVAFETSYDAPELSSRLAELFGVPMETVTLGERRLIVPSPKTSGGTAL